jgi:hypothetical protein
MANSKDNDLKRILELSFNLSSSKVLIIQRGCREGKSWAEIKKELEAQDDKNH